MMQGTTLYSLFMPPDGCYGDFGLMCGFTATPQVLGQIRRTFSGDTSRPVLAAFIHPTVNAVSDLPGLAWMWMQVADRGYNLLHAKVALLGFRRRRDDGYVLRLVVSTGNWTQDPLTGSIDLFWSIDVDPPAPDAVSIADIRAAAAMFGWLRQRADCRLIDRAYDGHRPGTRLDEAIAALPPTEAKPRFVDSREQALFPQVVDLLGVNGKANRLVLGSGYFDSGSDDDGGLPERLRQALVQAKHLTRNADLDLFLNPASCQGLAARADALATSGWSLRMPYSPHHGDTGSLHAKFVMLARGDTPVVGRVYLGSGNLTRTGFERSATQGGNLEAGVVVDLPQGLCWPVRRNTRHSIADVLPVQFTHAVVPQTLQAGTGFVPPEEPTTLPPVAWLAWQGDTLSAPDDVRVAVIGPDDQVVETPCVWPGPPPTIVTLVNGGWRLPVVASDALVVPRAPDLTVEDILAGLAAFPDVGDADQSDDGDEGGEAIADRSDAPEPPPATYAIRRMMELLVRLAEVQLRLDPRDWQRWCRELRETLCAIAQTEQAMIGFFQQAGVNPLAALADRRMQPEGIPPDMLTDALAVIARAWSLDGCPSLWDKRAA